MSLFSKIVGVASNLFQVGGPNGPAINNNASSLEATIPLIGTYTDFRALMLEHQQSASALANVTVPTNNTILMVQNFTNNGHIALQGTSRIVWVM
jgi:hypothetical protein